MEKELVIKVLYGETLRRFSVLFNGKGSLELDMAGLRTKISNLFKFAPDVDHTLTYVDEDGDRVTLVDDADLYDAIKQHLNPLRIFVSLNSDGAKFFDLTGSSTSLISLPSTSLGCIPLPPPAFTPMLPSPSISMGIHPFTPSRSQVSCDLTSNVSSSTKADPLGQQPFFSPSSLLTGTAPESYHDYIPKLTDTTVSMLPSQSTPMGFRPFTPSRSQVCRDLASNASSSIKADPLGQQPQFSPFPILARTAPELHHDYIPKLSDTNVSKAAEALWLENQIGMASKKLFNDLKKSEDCNTSDDLKTQKDTLSEIELLTITYKNALKSSWSASTSDPQNAAKNAPIDFSFPQLFSFNSGKLPQKEYNDYPSANPITFYGYPSPSTVLPVQELVEPPVAQQNNGSVSGQMVQNASNTGPPCFMHPQRINQISTALPVHNLVKPAVSSQNIHSVSGQTGRSASNTGPPCFMHPQRINQIGTALPVHNLVKPAVSSQNIHSVSGQTGRSASIARPSWFMPPVRISGKGDTMGETFHRGVRCDGCGLHPIIGPRFNSKVKVDYDLCSICFAALGNETDYTRLDHPLFYHSSRFPKFPHPRVARPSLLPNSRRMCRSRSLSQSKLNSQFIKDVNIVDGTLMAPLTPFTKIWRMHNNGAVSWPRGTQLVWMGGDRLTNLASVEVELPDEECLVGMDLNVAIDFTAPEQPGHYVSYWRMALPLGDKFGECIWVFIQVDASLRDTQSESGQSLNLNLPPAGVDLKDEVIDVNVEPVDATPPPNPHSDKLDAELVTPVVNENTSKEMEAMVDNLLLIPPEVPAVESLPTIESSLFLRDMQRFSGEVSDGISLEQSLLKDLEVMGFQEIDLNRDILRANQYDLERSLDDLCSVPKWDLMLEELQEMGFPDKETNRKLLIKNNGSIKRVVKDLIAAEKA